MPGQTETNEAAVSQEASVDPWAAAFAQLEQQNETDSEGTTDGGGANQATGGEQSGQGRVPEPSQHEPATPVPSDQSAPASDNVPSYSVGTQDTTGGSDTSLGDNREAIGGEDSGVAAWTSEDLESYENSIVEDIQNKAIQQINDQWVKSGKFLSYNGVLGANIYDERICKRDRDGVPHFYNAETGEEFQGDNPRQQAMDYINAYNAQLAPQYNEACKQVALQMLQEETPQIEVLRFAPTYEKMDPIRRALFDETIEDYQVFDKDNQLVGYSCDLNKVLDVVNKQVSAVQRWYDQQQKEQADKPQPPSPQQPALDMKASIAAGPKDKGDIKSLEDALLFYQNQTIEKGKK